MHLPASINEDRRVDTYLRRAGLDHPHVRPRVRSGSQDLLDGEIDGIALAPALLMQATGREQQGDGR